jgi:hypothetical protein
VLAKLRSPLTYPNVMATIAVFVALGGTSYAVATGSIDSRELKNNSVRSGDLRNNDVRGKDILKGAVTGSDVDDDSLTGEDVNESSLGTVPNASIANIANTASMATTADSAGTAGSVGGVTFRSFNFTTQADAAATQILSFRGLELSASCAIATAALGFTAASTVNDTQLDSYSVEADQPAQDQQNEVNNSDLDAGAAPVNLVPDDEDNEVGSLRYSKPDGTGVHVQWHAHNAGTGGAACAVNGVASAF